MTLCAVSVLLVLPLNGEHAVSTSKRLPNRNRLDQKKDFMQASSNISLTQVSVGQIYPGSHGSAFVGQSTDKQKCTVIARANP